MAFVIMLLFFSVVEVCVYNGGTYMFHVCFDLCIVYGVGVCIDVCGVVLCC